MGHTSRHCSLARPVSTLHRAEHWAETICDWSSVSTEELEEEVWRLMETRTIRRRDLDEDILIDSRTELIPFPSLKLLYTGAVTGVSTAVMTGELPSDDRSQSTVDWQVSYPMMTGLIEVDSWLTGELSYDGWTQSTVDWQVSYPMMTGLSRQLTDRWVILRWKDSVDSWLTGELSYNDWTQSTVDWQVSYPMMTRLQIVKQTSILLLL